ncbi:hypothetical protein BC830DRAFT_1103967 [Chytriomyces sp. MP71]|nr:hypothetical protein BC830DRAFT_1103967 [Chytriomyces sp. MP71]
MSCSEKCPGVSIPAQAPPCGGFRDGVIAWSVYKNTQAGTASPAPVPQAQPAISKIMAAVQQPQPQRQTQQFPQQGTQQQTTEQQTTQQGTQPSQQSQQQQQQQQSQQPDQQQPQQQQESSSQQQGAQEPGGNNQTVQQPASSNGAPNNQKSIFQMVENNVNASNQQTSSSLVIQSTSTTSVNSAFAAITITSLSPTAKGTGNRAEIASSDPDRDGDVDDKPTLKAMPTLAASSTDIHPVIAAHVIAGIAFACLVLVVGIALMYRRRLGANILPSVLPIAELDRKEDAGDVKSVARMYTVRKDDIESVLPTAGEIRPPSPTLERSKGTLDYYRFGSPNSGVTLKSAEDDHFSRKISVGKSSDSSANKSVPTLGVLRKDLAVRDSDLYSVRSGSSSASQNIASKSLSLARSTSLAKVPEGKVTPRSSRAKRSTNNSNRWNSRMRSFEVSRASYQSSSAPLSPASMYNRRIRASTTAKSESGRSSTTSRAPSSLFMNVLAYNLAQNAKAEDEARANRRSFPDDDVKENRRC